jgi:two-component system sensor histidine kinase RpfC
MYVEQAVSTDSKMPNVMTLLRRFVGVGSPGPAPAAANSQPISVSATEGGPVRYQVLLADDNRTVVAVMRQVLEHAGHGCVVVDNGEEALAELLQRRFDLALFDMNMPLMSGTEAIKAYQFIEPAEARTPIVIFSADTSEEARTRCLAAGAVAFIPKPIPVASLPLLLVRLARKPHDEGSAAGAESGGPVTLPPLASTSVLQYETLEELDRIGEDTEFVDRLLRGFIDDNRARIGKLEDLLNNRRYAEFKDTVHAIKGAAMSIGALSLKRTCQEIEQLAPADLERDARGVMATVHHAFEQLVGVLGHYREHVGKPPSNNQM